MPPKRNMKTMTIEEKSAIGIASNYGKTEGKQKAKPKAKNTKTSVPLPAKKQKKPKAKVRTRDATTFTPLVLKPKRQNRYPKAPTMRDEKPPGASSSSSEGMSAPLSLYRAHRIPDAGYGSKFTAGEGKLKAEYPPVPDPETHGFRGTPGANKLNMFHGAKSVFVARTKQQAMNFMNEVTMTKNVGTFGIYKISNPSEYDIVRVEASYSKASRQSSIDRVTHSYKQLYSNTPHQLSAMRSANKTEAGRKAIDSAMKRAATSYVDGPAKWNGEHVVKGPVKPEHVQLVAVYKLDNSRPKTSAPSTVNRTSKIKGNKYPEITTRQDQVPKYAKVQAAMTPWRAAKKQTTEEVEKAAKL